MARRVVMGFRVDHVVAGSEVRCYCRDCLWERAEARAVRRLRQPQPGDAARLAQWEEAANAVVDDKVSVPDPSGLLQRVRPGVVACGR